MPRGGARINSGPPPDPNALRRDRPSDKDGWTTLPAEGRRGRLPKWPLHPDIRLTAMLERIDDERLVVLGRIDDGEEQRGDHAKLAKLDQKIAEIHTMLRLSDGMEAELWKSLWRTPQAVAWDRLRWTREVALYVRWQVQAELGDLKAGQEARQWSDRLGLNPTALLRNRWKIGVDSSSAKSGPPAPDRDETGDSVKDRLKVIHGGGA